MEITNIEELFNLVSKEEFQKYFCESAYEEIKFLNEEFYNNYFIDILPSWELALITIETPSEVFNESDQKEKVINSFLSDYLNVILYNVYEKLDLTVNENIENTFNKEVLTALNINEIIDNLTISIGEFLDSKTDKILKQLKEDGLITPETIDITDIPKLENNVGDEYMLTEQLDYDNRDKALVDIDGNILIGKNGQTHAQVIQDYLDEISSDKKLEDDYYRPSDDKLDKILNPEYSAFGHIVDDNILIEETTLDNITIDNVVQDIKNNKIRYEKIYNYNGNNLTRVARNKWQ
jgi:hypothetical protein